MKSRMIRVLLCVVILNFVIVKTSHAKVWRVNPTPGASADFTMLNIAVSHATVLSGDTIYLEGSSTSHGYITLTKRLVIIGPGYFLSGAGANLGLQHSPLMNIFTQLDIDSSASGSVLMGVRGVSIRIAQGADNITITRCHASISNFGAVVAGSRALNIVINKCFADLNINANLVNFQVTNCILGAVILPNTIDALIRNNTITGVTTITNCYFSNNIITSTFTNSFFNCSVRYNFTVGSGNLPAGNNNRLGVPLLTLILNSGSSDGMYRLAAGSPAIAAGEPIGGETPDCGAYGTADPYRLSGIPAIPTIYSLSVPAAVPASATSMNITISTKSNN